MIPDSHALKALPSPSHIRVMILEPSTDHTSSLRFNFHQDLLSNLEGRYEAISYTWGTPDLEFPIHVEGEQGTAVFVTKNLDDGLRSLRHHTDKRWLWADAVCINQNDHLEKERQIRMMVNIFRGAKRVLAWLGPGGPSEDEAFHFLERLSRDPVKSLSGFSPYSNLAMSLRKLLALPYFTRLWIVQELVFNLDVVLRHGSTEFPFLRFCVAIEVLKDNLGDGGLPTTGLPPHSLRVKTRSLKKISQLWKRHTLIIREGIDPQYLQDTILELLVQFSDFACTDPRDRIYALYGMATDTSAATKDNDHSNLPLRIDYSLNTLQTYELLATTAMQSGQAHEILECVCERQQQPNKTTGWPSWVPDWRLTPSRSRFNVAFLARDINCTGTERDAIHLDIDRCITNFETPSICVSFRSHAFDHCSCTLEELCAATLNLYEQRGCQHPLHAAENITSLVNRWIPLNWSSSEALRLEGRLQRFFSHGYDSIPSGATMSQYDLRLRTTLRGRCVFMTAGIYAGWIGIGACEMEIGDKLIIGDLELSEEIPYPVPKAKPAWIVRPATDGTYHLIGDASVFLFQSCHN